MHTLKLTRFDSLVASHFLVISTRLTFWRDGFTVDGGRLHRYIDHKQFMQDIKAGKCPKEVYCRTSTLVVGLHSTD
jgi:hypothetical protein